MQAKGWLFLKVLLNRFHEGSPDVTLKALPQEDQSQAAGITTQISEISPAFESPSYLLKNIHYTWLLPVFQKIPAGLHALILTSLPEPHMSKLGKFLKMSPLKNPLVEPIKQFFINIFYDKFKDPEVLPVSFLPDSPLKILTEISKDDLVELIDFLGIYDLTEEIRHIIDKKSLKTLYLCLTPKKQQFLRICLHQKEKLITPKLELDNWKGDRQTLENVLHRRGLYRLGKALSGQHPHLFWHIIHKLDTGRGAILSKYFSQEEIPGVTPALTQQVLNILNFLKKKSES